jgi:hypothetical protein
VPVPDDPHARRRAALAALLDADQRCAEAAALGVGTRGLVWAELLAWRRVANEAFRAAEAAKAAGRDGVGG